MKLITLKMLENNHPKGYAQFLTPDGKLIFRRLYGKQLGNFVMLSVVWKNNRYHVGSGDEYLRGVDEPFLIEESRKWK